MIDHILSCYKSEFIIITSNRNYFDINKYTIKTGALVKNSLLLNSLLKHQQNQHQIYNKLNSFSVTKMNLVY